MKQFTSMGLIYSVLRKDKSLKINNLTTEANIRPTVKKVNQLMKMAVYLNIEDKKSFEDFEKICYTLKEIYDYDKKYFTETRYNEPLKSKIERIIEENKESLHKNQKKLNSLVDSTKILSNELVKTIKQKINEENKDKIESKIKILNSSLITYNKVKDILEATQTSNIIEKELNTINNRSDINAVLKIPTNKHDKQA